jgi:hypothetical protein
MPMVDLPARGAKSGGTGEPGSQKVNWPAESFLTKRRKFLKPNDCADNSVSSAL